MSGVNKVILVGRLGADPELKAVSENNNVVKLSVATSEKWTKDGQAQERTEWHRVIVWGKLADLCATYLRKGRQVYLEGKLVTRSWENNEGQKQYTTEIVANQVQFLGDPKEAPSAQNESVLDHDTFKAPDPSVSNTAVHNHAPGAENSPPTVSNDDLPF